MKCPYFAEPRVESVQEDLRPGKVLLAKLCPFVPKRRRKPITIWSYIVADYHSFKDDETLNEISLLLTGKRYRGSAVVRNELRERDNEICQRCGVDTKALPGAIEKFWHTWEADHIIPVSIGGKDVLSNMRTLCRGCHSFVSLVFAFTKKVAQGDKSRVFLLGCFDKLTEIEKVDFLIANQYDENREFVPEVQSP